jgi:hypothetical protein
MRGSFFGASGSALTCVYSRTLMTLKESDKNPRRLSSFPSIRR